MADTGHSHPHTPQRRLEIHDRALCKAREWTALASEMPNDYPAQLLGKILGDERGLDFTVRLTDAVIRPESKKAAAKTLSQLAARPTPFLPAYASAAMTAARLTTAVLPSFTVDATRKVFRTLVGSLVLDAREKKLSAALHKIRQGGYRVNLNLLGEAVLGKKEAEARRRANQKLIARPDVDYVSLKVSSIIAPHNPWGFADAVDNAVQALLPLYLQAADPSNRTFLNLDMEDYKDLDLTLEVFMRLLDDPRLLDYEAGIVLQAYLPDALDAYYRLLEWSQRRVARGGARIKIRLVKGANLAMERVDAAIHGWELTTWQSKEHTDGNYKRVLEAALTAENVQAIRLGVGGQNIFDIAYAWELAKDRGLREHVEFEMLAGMARGQAEVVRREVGHVLLYVPVVEPAQFDVAIAYLVRRLEENAASENYMSAVFDIGEDEEIFQREYTRSRRSLAHADPEPIPTPKRTQNRLAEVGYIREREGDHHEFANVPDSDPALAVNREWAQAIADRVPTSNLGSALANESDVSELAGIDELVESTRAAAPAWAERSATERANMLARAADFLQARRGELIEVAMSEAKKTFDQADVEVSEAIDFANWYGLVAKEYLEVDGATFIPAKVTLVVPPWNFPIAIPTGGICAALAAGSAVIIKPAPAVERCAAVIVQALWDAGIPRDVLRLVNPGEGPVGQKLICHPGIDRLVLTGAFDTATMFKSWRPGMHLLAETSGKNALIVMPSADPDLAVKDAVASAFGHAGQKCSAASLLILVGEAGLSQRIHDQIIDAVTSLHVSVPSDLSTQVPPVMMPDDDKLQRGMTTLETGEHWAVKPRLIDAELGLWTPGVRAGVKAGSDFHKTEFFAPVMGVMQVSTLGEAIAVVNAVEYGLTSGLHTLDADDLKLWLDKIEAGNLYVNRGTTGAIVKRQPFGGWKRSCIGPAAKAGGKNYLYAFGDWQVDAPGVYPGPNYRAPEYGPATAATTKSPDEIVADKLVMPAELAPWQQLALHALTEDEQAWVRAAWADDMYAWASEFGRASEQAHLGVERNIMRYRPTEVLLRLGKATQAYQAIRILGAAITSGAKVALSAHPDLPFVDTDWWNKAMSALSPRGSAREDDHGWAQRLGNMSDDADLRGIRIRLIGEDRDASAAIIGAKADVALYGAALTPIGAVELLPFVREQSISLTAHRFGTPFAFSEEII